MTGNRKTILIRSPNWIGDAVVSTAILGPLRDYYGDAKVSVVAREYVSPIFENNPFIDDIITFGSLTDGIRKVKGDIGFILPNSFSSALLFALSGVRRRIGYKSDMRTLLLTDRISMPFLREEQLVDNFKRITQHITGVDNSSNYVPGLFLSEEEKGKQIFEDLNLHLREKPVIIDPGSAYGPTKIWQLEKYAGLIDYIMREKKLPVILLGSGPSVDIVRKIMRFAESKPIVLTGKLSLRESITAISRCRLFISPDTGGMHIAAALGVSQIAIFGSSSPKWTAPLNSRARIIYENLTCSPCFIRDYPIYQFYNRA